MRYRVKIEQEDTSTKAWSLARLLRYLRALLYHWDVITLTFSDTRIEIERVE